MTRAASGRRGAAGRKPEHRQINCRISPGVAAALDECCRALEAKQGETVRTALIVLARLIEAERQGGCLLVTYQGRTIELMLPVIVASAGAGGKGARARL